MWEGDIFVSDIPGVIGLGALDELALEHWQGYYHLIENTSENLCPLLGVQH